MHSEIDAESMWELRSTTKAAPFVIEVLEQLAHAFVDNRVVDRPCTVSGAEFVKRTQMCNQLLGTLRYFLSLILPGIVKRLKQTLEAWQTMPVFRREIGTAKKRLQLRREKHRHRPAAMTGHHLYGFHVYFVEIGALLAIDLDVDKVLIHEFGSITGLRTTHAP